MASVVRSVGEGPLGISSRLMMRSAVFVVVVGGLSVVGMSASLLMAVEDFMGVVVVVGF